MSTMENHNDDLFRSRLHSYREMPSDNVWAGVQSALDKNKKKKRFVLWWWAGGIGFSAVAVLTAAFILHLPQEENTSPMAKSSIAVLPHGYVTASNNAHTTKEKTGRESAADIPSGQTAKQAQTATNSNTSESTGPSIVAEHKSDATHISTHVPSSPSTDRLPVEGLPVSDAHQNETHDRRTSAWITQIPNESAGSIPHDFHQVLTLPNPTAPVLADLVKVDPVRSIRFRPFISIQGYTGAVGYQRQYKPSGTVPNSLQQDSGTTGKTFGLYAGTSIEAGFMFLNGLYISAGVGYETQRFSDRQKFIIPGTWMGNSPTTDLESNVLVNTSFGNVTLPLQMEDVQSPAQTVSGKLVYQNHHLFFPIDIGYRYAYKRFGVNLGLVGAFHVPISQRAVFYSDLGETRTVGVNKPAPFNFSVGLEPMLEYSFAPFGSLTAGGTFRYSVLNAYQSNTAVSRPYVLAGNLGLRFYLR